MIRSIAILLFFTVLASCSIDEKTVFNSDFSGSTTISVDMTAMVSMMKGMDASAMDKFYRDMRQDKIDSILAVKNKEGAMGANNLKMSMSFDSTTNMMQMSFKFKTLEEANILAKNALESNSKKTANMVNYEWEKKGKVLIMPGVDSGSGEGGMGLDKMMFSIERTFPKKIASVSDDRISISSDRKTLTLKTSMGDLSNNPLPKIVVTFE